MNNDKAINIIQNQRIDFIRNRIMAELAPDQLEIIDQSHKHIGHADNKGGSHYRMVISSPAFANKSLIDCHRMVYAALGEAMGKEIHALKIDVKR